MKNRITNLLTATLWILLLGVWLPLIWTFLTVQGAARSHDSWVANFLEDQLYIIDAWSPEGVAWVIELGESFVLFLVMTLLVMGGRYLLAGTLSLRFVSEDKNDES